MKGRPGDRPLKGRGGPKRLQEGGRRSAPRRDRDDRLARAAERKKPAAHDDPILPDDVTGKELAAEVREELRTLPKDLATKVARHLVMAGRLAEEEPERAYGHARAARRLASRVGIVREAAGIAAYHAGEWADALAELRAARRLSTGEESYLPMMADCERGLGRLDRALDLIKSPEAKNLDPMGRVELRIVESGVRRDLGQYDAAVVTLQIPELRDRRLQPWSARLFYAYADALVAAGREQEASEWFARAAAADRNGETDAAERYAELEGLHIVDNEEGDGEEDATEEDDAARDEPAARAAADDETTDDATTQSVAKDQAAENGVAVGKGDVTKDGEAGTEVAQNNAAGGGEVLAAEDGGGSVERTGDSAEAPATGIEFRAPGTDAPPETPVDEAPGVPAVFLEPKPADGERPQLADDHVDLTDE
ncbi:MAG TPA: hypothetical protein VIL71_09960 [Spirillospora sp.]